MAILLPALLLVAGLGLLGLGADLLVRGAVTVARVARISATVIGLTIVATGTSLPELTVGVSAAMRGAADLVVGTVVGSNIFNIGLVIGLTALLRPMTVHPTAVRYEWPFMFVASVLFAVLAGDGRLDRLDGLALLLVLALFLWFVVHISRLAVGRAEQEDLAEQVDARELTDGPTLLWKAFGWIVAGIVLLAIGGEALVRGASDLARAIGISERLIGLTIVAIGTGSPEIATSIIAIRRGEGAIALGNVIGSNLLNIAGILGLAALIAPTAVHPAILGGDLRWMLALSALLLPIMWWRSTVSRLEGGLLLGLYGTYLALLVFGA